MYKGSEIELINDGKRYRKWVEEGDREMAKEVPVVLSWKEGRIKGNPPKFLKSRR